MLGAGPAGLTAAYVLALRGRPAEVFEADGVVGGIAKTVEFQGYRFDLGGHRFFTKLEPIARLWEEMLGDELLTRPRLSRIYYRGKFFSYPLVAKDVVARLGLVESTLCALSYLWSRVRPKPEPASFEDWVTTHFGRRLYDAFFRSYTEKVWGIPGAEVKAEWAAQREDVGRRQPGRPGPEDGGPDRPTLTVSTLWQESESYSTLRRLPPTRD